MRKFRIAKFILLASLAITAFTYAVMFLWNALIPELFHGPVITFLQALGLLVLSKILFKGFGWHGGHWRNGRWSERMQERMNAMTPEEREKFREKWSRRCGPSWHMKPSAETGTATTE